MGTFALLGVVTLGPTGVSLAIATASTPIEDQIRRSAQVAPGGFSDPGLA
jgi:hypothetical protein